MKQLKIVNICAYFSNNPKSGGQERIFQFNSAISKYNKSKNDKLIVNVEQFSQTPVLMFKKKISHSKNYKEIIKNHLAYTIAVVMMKIFKIRNYDFIIPFAFKFVQPSKELKNSLKNTDLIQVEHPWLVEWILKYKNKETPVVLVEHNVEIDLQKNFFNKSPLKKFAIKSIKQTEQKALNSSNVIFAVSSQDKNRLSENYKISKNKISIVPNGANISKLINRNFQEILKTRKHLKLPPDSKIALFIGSDHPPNHEAVDFIINDLAPKNKDIIFLIVGEVGVTKNQNGIRIKESYKNVICTGVVDSLEAYYLVSDIAINPIFSGSGSNLKLLGYLSNGMPTISTPMGSRGVNIQNKKDIIISSKELFSKEITNLINDAKLQKNMSSNAIKRAKLYDWDKIAKIAVQNYRVILKLK